MLQQSEKIHRRHSSFFARFLSLNTNNGCLMQAATVGCKRFSCCFQFLFKHPFAIFSSSTAARSTNRCYSKTRSIEKRGKNVLQNAFNRIRDSVVSKTKQLTKQCLFIIFQRAFQWRRIKAASIFFRSALASIEFFMNFRTSEKRFLLSFLLQIKLYLCWIIDQNFKWVS